MTKMEIKELYQYMTTASEEQNDRAIEVLSEIMHDLQTKYPAYYKKYDEKLEKIYKHGKLTEAEAKHYVSQMRNKDGTTGEHWTLGQTTDYLMGNQEFAHLNPICFYVAMNMMYSDYYKPTRTLETYA
ncbi:MAG: hypothetical protein J5601_04055, partial [Elusimicrobiaceae bacterium]|nr:hypothetical protein [Elusimicrobiaceae bacterium]